MHVHTVAVWRQFPSQICGPHYRGDHATCWSDAETRLDSYYRHVSSGRDLWRQIALNCRGCLSSGCHQLFIGLSLSTRTLNHFPTGLVVVVLRRHLHTHAHMHRAFNAHVCTQNHSDKHTLLNGYLHSFSHSLCPHPPTPETPVMKTRCYYSPRTEGSSSATQLSALSPLLTVEAP